MGKLTWAKVLGLFLTAGGAVVAGSWSGAHADLNTYKEEHEKVHGGIERELKGIHQDLRVLIKVQMRALGQPDIDHRDHDKDGGP